MKILYRQQAQSVFESIGLENCYLKMLKFNKDLKNISKKEHHHAGFEIHIINNGHQIYKSGDEEYSLNPGCFIIIPPGCKHLCVSGEENTEKFSITFSTDRNGRYSAFFSEIEKPVFGKSQKDIFLSLNYVLRNYKNRGFLYDRIVENRIFEIVILLLASCGFDDENDAESEIGEDVRVTIAKQYIKDNIESNLRVCDVAAYCYLSKKQLTRLFMASDDMTVLAYIHNQRISHIEKLIQKNYSLREISERMDFSNEYHFNLFFKKYYGMPPGEYRKTMEL